MNTPIRLRLSLVMFLFYFAAGAHIPIISLYLNKVLGFSGAQTGLVLSMSALSAVAAPLLGSFVADRLLSTERLLGTLQIISGVLMFLLTFQQAFLPVFLLFLFYKMSFGPGVALTNSVVFHHAPDARRQFGGIRKWGTIGWVAAGWLFSLVWMELLGGPIDDALQVAAAVSILLGLYSFTIPGEGGREPRRSELIPRAALRLFGDRRVILVAVTGFLMQVVTKYFYFGTAPFLKDMGFPESAIMPSMTVGQFTEVAALAVLGGVIARLGYRRALLLGTVMEICRYSLLLLSTWFPPLAVAGVAFHGPSFAFFFTTAFIYLDSFTDAESRAGLQQLFSVVTIGLGNFAGSLIAGFIYDAAAGAAGQVNYMVFWLVPLTIAVAAWTILYAGRRRLSTAAE
jgi:predicted MFS family arabinose efflux permease